MAQQRTADQPIDVVLVHGPADADWAGHLDARLREDGLSTYVSAADLRPGDDITAGTDDAFARARTGIILIGDPSGVSATAQFSALVRLADEGRLRLIPVLLSSAPMPPLLNRFQSINLIGAESEADVDRCMPALLAAIRETPGRVDGWAPALRFDRVPEGPIAATLRIGDQAIVLSSPAGVTSSGPDDEIVTLLRDPVRIERRHRDLRPVDNRAADRIVLDGAVGAGLLQLVRLSRKRGTLLRLAIEVAAGSPLNDVPWEGLCVPGEDAPLALVPNVVLFRSVPDLGETVDPHIAGPLRILAVIASPERGGGPLLDYEHELATILEQVEAARREKAYVRVLNWGSAGAIREALEEERFHVLHISCHADPGRLVLEKPDGEADLIDAETFVRRVLVPGKMVPLVVLAGCSTARAGQDTALPSYAQTLLANGVPAVLAMTAAVDDLYATALLARTYRQLAREPERPDPLVALSEARRACETERRDLPASDPRRQVVEWTTPTLFTRVRSLVLFNPTDQGPVPKTAGPRIARAITSLAIGDFVGRRRELRLLLKTMRRPSGAGVVIHGMGGVGKSTLAAAALREIGTEGRTVVTMHGPRQPAEILRLIGKELRSHVDSVTLEEITDEDVDWRERLDAVEDVLRDGRSITLLLDDPLGDPLGGLEPGQTLASATSVPRAGAELLDFLDRWLGLGPGALVVVTLRMAESLHGLPDPARLTKLHLGELSPAEVQKLMWRLPWVYHLDRADRDRAYREIGGHPRCLEYLNALLGAGRSDPEETSGARVSARRGTFDNVSRRLMKALEARGVERPETATRQTLDTALKTVVATSAAEVLLDELYHRLDDTPAQRLLAAASVFRTPVDDTGLNWVLAEEAPADPDRADRLRSVYDRLRAWPGGTLDTLPLPHDEREQLNRDLLGSSYPARDPDLDEARRTLLDLSLLSPAGSDDDERFLVHRWTARSLDGLADETLLAGAHARAAAYHRWHGELYEPDANLTDLREVHHHAWAAGDTDAAVVAAAELCARLHARGAYDEERMLCEQTLTRLDPGNPQTAVFLHAKALIAEVRGDYDTAVALQTRCLDLATTSDDGPGLATGRQQLGVIAQLRGDATAAAESYHAAMQICFPIADQSPRAEAVLAACYQQLGALALERGDPDDAERWSHGARGLIDELGDSATLSRTDDDLARLALAFGDTALADEHQLGSWELQATQPDILRLAATTSLQLGAVHVLNDRPEPASDELDRAVELAERLGDIPLLARCLQLSGDVLFELYRFDDAEQAYRLQRELLDRLDDQSDDLIVVYQQLGRVTAARGDRADATGYFDSAMTLAERAGNARLVAATHLYRGVAALDGPDHAVRSLTAGREAAMTARDDTLWISCQLELAALAAAEGRLEEASELMAEGSGRAVETGNESAVVACCVVSGLLAREGGDDDDAVLWFLRGQALADRIGHQRVSADCDLHLGRIASDRRNFALAEKHYEACLARADPDRHVDLVWGAWRELGRSRSDRDEHEEAVAALTEALRLVTGTGQPWPEMWCLIRLLWSQVRTGDAEGARATASRCAETAKLLPPIPYTAVAFLCAGDVALDADDPETARAHYERAMAIADAYGDAGRPQKIDAAWQLGRLGPPDEAAGHFTTACRIAEQIGDRVAAAHARREIGRAVRDSGDAAEGRLWLGDAWLAGVQLDDHRLVAVANLLIADLDEAEGDTERAAALREEVAQRFPSRAARPRRADHHPLYAATTRAWRDLQWSRRLRTADGETGFVRVQARYLGPSVDHVVREMTPRASLVQGVPAVVAPRVGRAAK